jgi:hypothetical protein
LSKRYDGLKKEIEKSLYEHLEPYRDAIEEGTESTPHNAEFLGVKTPAGVWPFVKPVRITVEDTGSKRLEVAYETAWDEEHTVGATIENWKVTNFSGSVGP